MTVYEYLLDNTIMDSEVAATYSFLDTGDIEKIQNCMKYQYGMFELIFDDDLTTELLVTILQNYVKMLFDVHNYNWTKKKNTITIAYTPFNTTDYTLTSSVSDSGSDSNVQNETFTPQSSITKQKNTFDNSTFQDVEKDVNAGTDTKTNNNTLTYGKISSKTDHKIGWENVDYENIIEKERKIAEYNFLEMIANEICQTISILNYNFI